MRGLKFWHSFMFLALFLALLWVAPTRSEANAYIQFSATSVNVMQGVVEINGVLYNSGNVGATLNTAEVFVNITDANGNFIWSDSGTFYNCGVYVPAGGNRTHTFYIHNENCQAYNGRIRWHVNQNLYW